MSGTDPIARLPAAFGKLLRQLRANRGLETDAIASEVGLISAKRLASMEGGEAEPTLTEFFRIADTLSESPAILLIDLITSWRGGPVQS